MAANDKSVASTCSSTSPVMLSPTDMPSKERVREDMSCVSEASSTASSEEEKVELESDFEESSSTFQSADENDNETKDEKLTKSAEDDCNVKVYLRLRPHKKEDNSDELEYDECEDDALVLLDECTVKTISPKDSQAYKNREPSRNFSFTKVFNKKTNQQELFEETTKPLIDKFLQGKDGLLFAYGVTNAGKTYTIEGTDENPGIIPITIQQVFERLSGSSNEKDLPVLSVSYLQVYNDQIHDLHAFSNSANKSRTKESLKVKLRGDAVEVDGLKCTRVKSCQEALDIVANSREERDTRETNCNVSSSRSHSVFILSMAKTNEKSSEKPTRLYIVDLAGSERGKRAMTSKIQQREASNINCSLMNLMRCLDTMRLNQKKRKLGKREKVIPFRECKLTLLFRDCFFSNNCGGVAMIVNASARSPDFDETTQALKYGAIAKNMKIVRPPPNQQKARSSYDHDGHRIQTDGRMDPRSRLNLGTPERRYNMSDSKTIRCRTYTFNGLPSKPFEGCCSPSCRRLKEREVRVDDTIDAVVCSKCEGRQEAFTDFSKPIEDSVISALVHELADARMKCVTLETEVRKEVAKEMEKRLCEMETTYRQRVDCAKKIADCAKKSLRERFRKTSEHGGTFVQTNLDNTESIFSFFENEMKLVRELHVAEVRELERKLERMDPHQPVRSKISPSDSGKNLNRGTSYKTMKQMGAQLRTIARLKDDLAAERSNHSKTVEQLEKTVASLKEARQSENQARSAAFEWREKSRFFEKKCQEVESFGLAIKRTSDNEDSRKATAPENVASQTLPWFLAKQSTNKDASTGNSQKSEAKRLMGGTGSSNRENNFNFANLRFKHNPLSKHNSVDSSMLSESSDENLAYKPASSLKRGIVGRMVNRIRR